VSKSSRKLQLKERLDKKIAKCKQCPGMNIRRITQSAPGFGNVNSPIMMIGQSLCHECMKTQIPFTGGSGLIVDRILNELKILKKDIFITNLLHCHPIGNRPSRPNEIKNCLPYLIKEINIVKPKIIIGFGTDVRKHVTVKHRTINYCYHPAYIWRQSGLNGKLTDSYVNTLVRYLRRYV